MSMARVNMKKGFLASVGELIVLLFIVFVIRTIGFGLYQVPTGSMETTMLVGERFFADKFTILFSKPKRGSIIAMNDPTYPYSTNTAKRLFEEYVWGPSNWTKRVIGIPGDHVRGVVEDGKPVVYVNDKKIDEPYLNKFPLLLLWTENPHTLTRVIEEEAAYLMSTRQLAQENVSAYFEYALHTHTVWRPYDAQFSFQKQPYYRMDPSLIIKAQQAVPGETLTPDGMLLKEPGVALPGPGKRIQHGNGYYTGTDEFDIHLGNDEYWLMGDNR